MPRVVGTYISRTQSSPLMRATYQTTAQVLEFYHWRQNPDGFKDAHTLYEVPPRTIFRWADSRDSSALKRKSDDVGNEGKPIWSRKRRRMRRE
jgi:hypothetical protein